MQETASPAALSSTERKERAALWSIVASAAITLGKGVAGFATGSLALISDAAQSLLDVAATTATYLAVRVAGKPADAEHHWGHGKVESVAALGQTAFLFLLSGAVAFEGVRRLAAGETGFSPSWAAAGVLAASIVVDLWRWWSLKRVARETGSEALAADALHFAADLVNSALVLAAFGAAALGFPQADALVAVGVAVFIAVAGLRLAHRTVVTLLDTAPKGAAELIRDRIAPVPGVVGIDWVRLRLAGGDPIGEVGIRVSRTLPLERVAEIKAAVEEAIAASLPAARVTVTANPIQVDEETIQERVMLIAAHRRLAVHHITVQNVGQRLSVSCDIEVDARATLAEAHEIATGLEAAIRADFGAATEVETHIEPLEVDQLPGREADAATVADIAGTLARRAGEGGVLSAVHHIRVRETPSGLVVNYHCRCDPGLDVASVHAAVDALDRRLCADMPGIGRVVGHAEPAAPPLKARAGVVNLRPA